MEVYDVQVRIDRWEEAWLAVGRFIDALSKHPDVYMEVIKANEGRGYYVKTGIDGARLLRGHGDVTSCNAMI